MRMEYISRLMERASEMIGVSVRTLYRIQKKARHPVNKKPRKKRKGKHDLDKCVVRRSVANMYGKRKIFSNCGEHSEGSKGQHPFYWQQYHFTAYIENK